jgi:hypothetical protein
LVRSAATMAVPDPRKGSTPSWPGAIAHAVSPDGLHWTKSGDRLAVQGSGSPGDVFCALSGVSVLREGDAIKLWYGTMPYQLRGAWETLIGYAEYRTRE